MRGVGAINCTFGYESLRVVLVNAADS